MSNVPKPPCHGVNTRIVLKWAKKAGCNFVIVNGTGDGRLTHPNINGCVTFNSRRKDAPRSLTGFTHDLHKTFE